MLWFQLYLGCMVLNRSQSYIYLVCVMLSCMEILQMALDWVEACLAAVLLYMTTIRIESKTLQAEWGLQQAGEIVCPNIFSVSDLDQALPSRILFVFFFFLVILNAKKIFILMHYCSLVLVGSRSGSWLLNMEKFGYRNVFIPFLEFNSNRITTHSIWRPALFSSYAKFVNPIFFSPCVICF